jgi:hypothetical protein
MTMIHELAHEACVYIGVCISVCVCAPSQSVGWEECVPCTEEQFPCNKVTCRTQLSGKLDDIFRMVVFSTRAPSSSDPEQMNFCLDFFLII